MTDFLDRLEQRAADALPEEVFAYFRQGSAEGISAGEAANAWARHRFLPRVLMDVTDIDLSTTLVGTKVRTPIGVAPTTLQRAASPGGEVDMARAAHAEGALLVVTSNAGSTFEAIAETGVSWWLQMYVTADRTVTTPVVERAIEAGAQALVLTADTPVVARKNGAARTVWGMSDPTWIRANFDPHDPPGQDATGSDKARDLGPQDIAWLAGRFGLPVVVKGVMHPQDARRCIDAGAAAIWVSNHGGRQLDRSLPTAEALAAVVREVGQESEVYVDGGIRGGADALVAGALGAKAVFLGRSPLYGLAVEGEQGARRVIQSVTEGLREALTLAGIDAWSGVTSSVLAAREEV